MVDEGDVYVRTRVRSDVFPDPLSPTMAILQKSGRVPIAASVLGGCDIILFDIYPGNKEPNRFSTM